MPNPINLSDSPDLTNKSINLKGSSRKEKKEERKIEKETKLKIANFRKRKQRIMSEDGYSYM